MLTNVFVSEMLQQLQFAICPFGEDWSAERLHDFLDRNRLCGQLIPRGALYCETYQYGVFLNRRRNGESKAILGSAAEGRGESHTRPVQKHPFLRVANLCICGSGMSVS
jgi:hypothetical protein